jgi:hypothetical protein
MAEKKTEKKSRTNSGNRGSRKTSRDAMSLVIMGKGQFKTFKPVSCSPWLGTLVVFGSFDKKQALLNRELGLTG